MNPEVKEIFSTMKIPPTDRDKKKIEEAYLYAEMAHRGQERLSGEPYFVHPFETAKNLARFGMGTESIVAGLLHDVIEDTPITEEEFEKKFGKRITFLVNGVTKLGKLKYKGHERYAESLRRLLIASAKDVRVLAIKLADRLHNAQTLKYHTPEKAKRVAEETIKIYAPIAYRLGMGKLIGELQDAAFPYAHPKEYEMVREFLKQRKKLNEKYVEKVWKNLKKEMALQGIEDVETHYRIKSLYSLWHKLKRKGMDGEQIYDIIALRIVVPEKEDCYKVLGLVHTLWKPLPGRIKDFIALPKTNGYQSIHTTIFTGDGGIAEIQIRTPEMHQYAQYGLAAHYLYKTKGKTRKTDLRIIKEIEKLDEKSMNSKNFLEIIQKDILEDRIFVFTPEGDTMDLPTDSTPIDFAYNVHTEIGNHIESAQVNGKQVAIKTKLKTGDIVSIKTNQKVKPNRKWLRWVKTMHAKREIKSQVGDLIPTQINFGK